MSSTNRVPSVPVTLVVPVLNEEASVVDLLETLEAQTLPPREVIVVDGGSRDGTVELVRSRSERSNRLRLVIASGPASPGTGRNIGVAAANCDWIAFTDAGIRVDPDWMEQLWAAHLAAPEAQVIYGNFEFDLRSPFEEHAALAYCSPKRMTPAGPCRGPSVVSLLLRREAFEMTGGFSSARAGEDKLFLAALQASRVTVAWAPRATVRWRLRPDLRSTAERFRLYSHANVLAGLQKQWHHRLARSYSPVIAGLVLAVRSPGWLVFSSAALGGRALARVRRHEEGRGWRWVLQPRRLLAVTAIMVVTDVASVLGWWQAVRDQRAEQRRTSATSDGS